MRDRLLIFAGLFVFWALFTFPIWRGVAAHTSTSEPTLLLPGSAKVCIAPLDSIRAEHMKLLITWRDGLVREHRTRYTAWNGTSYKVSLTGTCLGQCHGSNTEFCDRCHSYVAVSTPTCWNCHQDVSARSAAILSANQARRMP
jgi:hypothetical protein